MKKEMLPDHIRDMCPDGLTDEQVETFLLGYLAGKQSTNTEAEQAETPQQDPAKDRQVETYDQARIRKRASNSSDSAREPPTVSQSTYSSSEGAIEHSYAKQNDDIAASDGAYPLHERKKHLQTQVFDGLKEDPEPLGGRARSSKIGPYASEPTSRRNNDRHSVTNHTVNSNLQATVAVIFGMLSAVFYEVGIIPIIGLGMAAWAIIVCRRTSEKRAKTILGWSACSIFFVMSLKSYGHLTTDAELTIGLITAIASIVAGALITENKYSSSEIDAGN